MNNRLLKCGDVVFVNLPSHNPKGHEQEGRRPAVIVGVPLGDLRYPVAVVVPLTTQFGNWVNKNPLLYPIIRGVQLRIKNQPSFQTVKDEENSG